MATETSPAMLIIVKYQNGTSLQQLICGVTTPMLHMINIVSRRRIPSNEKSSRIQAQKLTIWVRLIDMPNISVYITSYRNKTYQNQIQLVYLRRLWAMCCLQENFLEGFHSTFESQV